MICFVIFDFDLSDVTLIELFWYALCGRWKDRREFASELSVDAVDVLL